MDLDTLTGGLSPLILRGRQASAVLRMQCPLDSDYASRRADSRIFIKSVERDYQDAKEQNHRISAQFWFGV